MTCLYVCKTKTPNLIWGKGKESELNVYNYKTSMQNSRQPLPFFPEMGVAKLGDNGRKKLLTKQQASGTPPEFRNLIISLARSENYDAPPQPVRTLFAMDSVAVAPLQNPHGIIVDIGVNA